MHVVVVGCGRVGSTLARQLVDAGHEVVVIDKNAGSLDRLSADFGGRTMVGVGFDRGVLRRAGLTDQSAVMAVTSGDNSNILIARVARETFGVERVVARIYDPRRATIYERLGIPTVASVGWTAGRALRLVLPDNEATEWTDPTSQYVLVERRVPASAAGKPVSEVEVPGTRVVLLTRLAQPQVPAPSLLVQQDDVLHLMVPADGSSRDVFAPQDGGHR
ncbi:MAG: TrkA family potassium uptake protein [Actinomycetota bacterium]|nr:TrkA family potassium uptake protein [Actinomycetota bacterium]